MHSLAAYAIALATTFVINLPFGYWRQGLRKLSPMWFVAIHAPVPMVILLRFMLGLPFRWIALPFFVVAYFSGQFIGSRLRLRRQTRGSPVADITNGVRSAGENQP